MCCPAFCGFDDFVTLGLLNYIPGESGSLKKKTRKNGRSKLLKHSVTRA